MKIVKNNCFGGFSLSPKGVKRFAELEGKECYFFKFGVTSEYKYKPLTLEEAEETRLFWTAFSVPDPDKYLEGIDTSKDYKEYNARYAEIDLDSRPDDRANPNLVKVVEELGDEANGICADLEVVEIPDGIEYEIDEYDGLETIREKHRSW